MFQGELHVLNGKFWRRRLNLKFHLRILAVSCLFMVKIHHSPQCVVVLPPPLRQSVLLRVRKSHTVRRAAMQHRTMSVRVMVRELTKRALLCAIRFFQGGVCYS